MNPFHFRNHFRINVFIAAAGAWLAVSAPVAAATRTISNAGGNWNATGTWVEGAVPTAADDVVATATSGNLTINAAAACRSINLTNYTKIVTHNAAVTLSIGDATAGAGNNALVFPASGWTYTLGNNTTSAISFITTSATAQTVNFGGKTLGNVTFNGTGAVWILTGSQASTLNTITMTAGTIRVNNSGALGSGTVTISGAVTLDNTSGGALTLGNNAYNWNSNFTFTGTNDLNIGSGNVTMNATRTLTINGGQFTVGGVIAGVGFGLTKAGAGTLILSGNNTFSGATTLSAGTLRATTSAGALGTGTLALNGGTLELANDTGLSFNRNTTIGAAVTIESDRLTSGAGVTHTLGTLSVGNFTAAYNVGGNVTSGTAGITFGATTFSASTPGFNVASGANVTLGAITGNFNFTKSGAGQLTLNSASTRSAGSSTVSAGTLQLGSASGLGTTATTLVLSGGTLDLEIDSSVNAYPTTVSGASTINAGRATSGAGITHTLGTLSIGNFTLNVNPGTNVASGTAGLTFGATTLTASTPVFDVATGALLTCGALSGAFNIVKQDTGQMTLGSASTKAGGSTTVTGGTLKLGSTSALGTTASTLILNGGTLELATDTTINAYPTTVNAASNIVANRATAGAGVTHTLGTLSMGTFTLSVDPGAGATSGTMGVTFGATTLTGNPTFDVQNGGSAAMNVTLGAVTDGTSVARTITKANTGTLTFGSAATSLINGTAVNITGGTLASNNATGLGALADVDVAGGCTFQAGASQTVGMVTGTGSVNLQTFTLTIGGTNNHSGTFDGTTAATAGSIIKAGTGSLTLTGTLAHTGNTRVNAGTLRAEGGAGSLGAGTLTLGGGTLELADDTGLAFNRNTTVAAASTIVLDRLTSGPAVSYTLGTLSIGNFAVAINAGANVASGTAGLTFGATTLSASTPNFNVGAGVEVLLGAITGNFNMTKSGAGQLTLNTASARSSGSSTLSAGTLELGSASALGTTGTTLVLNGGMLNLVIDSSINAYNTTVGGAATINSGRATSGAGITHTLGTLSIGNFTLNVAPGANVASGTAGVTFGATTLSASTPIFDVGAGCLVTLASITGSQSFTKQDVGQLTIAGAAGTRNSGTTTLTDGTLKLGNASALGSTGTSLVLNGGTLEIAADTTINAYNTTIGGDVNVVSSRATSGTAVTHTLGTLSIGAFTINVTPGSLVTSGAQGLTFGATTLTGNPIFDVQNGGTPTMVMTLGAVTDGASVARTITKSNTGTLAFGSAATSLINGTQINVTGGQVNSNNATGIGALAAVDISGGCTFQIGASQTVGMVTGSGTINLQTFTLTVGNATNNLTGTFDGNTASSAGGLTKAGSGTLTLTGNNLHTGATTVSAGTLRAEGNAGALGAGTLSIGAATLELADDAGLAFNRNTTITGAATIRSDTVNAGPAVTHTLGTLSIGNVTVAINAGSNVTGGTAGVTFGNTTFSASTPGFNVGAGAEALLGAITGNFNFTKSGAGQLTLNSASARSSGSSTVSAGILQLGSSSALGTTGTTLVLSGGTLDLQIDSSVNAYNTTVSGASTINSGRATSGAGVTHTLGTLSIGNFQLNVNPGANVASGTAGVTFGNTTFSASTPVLDVASGANLTLGAISGNFNFVKQDAGQLTLNTASTRSAGSSTVSGGTLQLGIANGLGTTGTTLVLSGGTLDIEINSSVNAYNTTVSGNSTISSGRSSSGAGVTHTLGTLSIGNFQLTINPGANVASGTAGVTFGNTTLSASTPVFDVASGALLTVAAISGNFSFEKDGAGQMTTGTASARSSGSTTVSGGTLRVGAASALGTAGTTLVLNGGTLELATDASVNAWPTTVNATSTLVSNRATNGAGITHTLGTLSIGGATLAVDVGAAATSGTQGVTFGATTLSGDPTFDVQNGGSAALTVTLGAVNDGASARTITKSNTGTLTFGSAAASVSAGTVVDVNGGTVNSNNATALGSGATIDTASGSTFQTGASQTVGSVINAGTLALAGFTLTVGGDFSNTGTFTHGNGPVVFSGAVTHDIAGSTSFHTFRCTASGATLSFGAGTTTTVTNTLDLQNVTLVSSSAGNYWDLVYTGSSQTLTNVDVQDSDASGGSELLATGGTDSGHNLNWDFDVPSAISTMVLTSTTGATIRIAYTSVGDDANAGTISGGQITVQYTTDNAFAAWSPTGGQPGNVFRVTFPINGVAPGTASLAFIPSLTGGSVYYVRMWTSDSSSRYSAISNAGSVSVAVANNDVTLSAPTIAFGSLAPGSVNVISTPITITNTGNTNQTYQISITNPAQWSATSGAPGTDEFRLTGVIRTSQPASGDFDTGNDVITTSAVTSSETVFARDADAFTEKAVNVLPGETRKIWFRIEIPSLSTTDAPQTIPLVVQAL